MLLWWLVLICFVFELIPPNIDNGKKQQDYAIFYWSFWGAGHLLPVRGRGGEWWRCPFREILKDFQTDPPIHHSFLEMASYCTYCESDVSPVRRGNYKIIPWIQILPKFTTHFFYSGCLLFMAVTLNFISCSLLLCTTFMTFIMTHQVMLHCVKMTPSKMATLYSQVINDQPLTSIMY